MRRGVYEQVTITHIVAAILGFLGLVVIVTLLAILVALAR